jgi:hypothetical protein
MAKKPDNKVTSKPVASKASETLSSKSTGQGSKSAAASALSQTNAPDKQTQPKAASAASKTLSDGRTSDKAKSAAASALSQTPRTNKKQ